MTLNGEHLFSDVLRLCGGRNVFAALPALAPQVDIEAVLAADPEVIVVAVDDEDSPLSGRLASLALLVRSRPWACLCRRP